MHQLSNHGNVRIDLSGVGSICMTYALFSYALSRLEEVLELAIRQHYSDQPGGMDRVIIMV